VADDVTGDAAIQPWTFGVEPLPQTVALADRLRRVAGLLQALESEHPEVAQLAADLARAEAALASLVPSDPRPRIGDAADGDGRAYVDHARHVGAFNPAFPEYTIEVDGDRASGTVSFPLLYEGPPGLVHGGFLALLFDCVVQHHSCDVGVAGKTTSLVLRYRRPTPLLVPLTFTIERTVADGRIRSVGRLLDGDRLLCEAEVESIEGDRSALPAVSPRRLGQ
jgi:hypothetical protein